MGGFERVYEIGRIFRNEGMALKHNPEFTSIELYEAYAGFHDMMDIAEGILSSAAKEILGTYQLEWMGRHRPVRDAVDWLGYHPGGNFVPHDEAAGLISSKQL